MKRLLIFFFTSIALYNNDFWLLKSSQSITFGCLDSYKMKYLITYCTASFGIYQLGACWWVLIYLTLKGLNKVSEDKLINAAQSWQLHAEELTILKQPGLINRLGMCVFVCVLGNFFPHERCYDVTTKPSQDFVLTFWMIQPLFQKTCLAWYENPANDVVSVNEGWMMA